MMMRAVIILMAVLSYVVHQQGDHQTAMMLLSAAVISCAIMENKE